VTRIACAALLLATACVSAGTGPPAPVEAGVRDDEPGSPPPPVAYRGEILRLGTDDRGFQRPRPTDDDCLPDALRRATGAAGMVNKVKFAVLRDGSLVRFSYLTPVTRAQARAVEAAFASCSWNPGFDPAGRPVAVWVIQPIKVVGAPPPDLP
jgi:hypothetical protein